MSSKTTNGLVKSLLAPLSGQVISLEQVPDEVFSQKILGDGIAIIPSDGKLYAPVDGEIASVAETLHAYGFTGADGLEILVHVGLDSVKLKGEGFKSHVQVGEKVTAGQLVAEVDLQYLESQGVPTITPVLICKGAENVPMSASSGTVTAGKDTVIKLGEETTAEERPVAEEPEKKPGINFDFLQKLGKVLMTVIAVMPAAGIMLSLGKLLQMADLGLAITVGSTMENIGWAIITNLHILFAAAIGGSWAKERAGGAFAAVISFILINRITGAVFGVTTDMLTTPGATVNSFFGQEMLVENYFTNILGSPALNMGVFVGIIAGFVGGMVYNKFYNFRSLPDALAFFNGKRFVPLAVIFYSAEVSLVMALVWPVVQTGINAFGVWIANSAETSPILAPFIYGTLERLLLPFGLHHMLTIPMNYTSFGGEYMIQTGINAGSMVYGQDPLWLAWITDLINFKDAGDIAAYENLLATVIPARFKVGQMIGATGLLTGIALAMYRHVDADKRKSYRSMHFNRAGIDELTEAVENGMIDAVIVKDLSRLGRHKTQTALYIDYLRQNNVRVLSATESIDTFNEADDLIIGFKGLMNDYYARDGSRRVTAGLRQKQRAGLVITPPFGYFKDKNTKQVVIVPEAAETIHLIFSSYLDGKGVKAIAAMLNENGNKTPALMQKHLIGKRLPEKQELIIKKYLWDATMVSRILQDESYTGTLICHKSERNKINKTNRATSPDEQFRHENFLPTIIPRDLWEQAQTLMAMRKRESVRAGEGRPILRYSGLIACGDCGRAFTGKRVKQKNGERVEYICSTYLRYGKEHCGAHAIREEYLDDIVRQELQNTKNQYQTLWTQLEKAIEGWLPKTTNTQQQLKKQRERIELLEEEVETILMERIRDKENAQRYDRMIAKREEQIANAQKRIEELENIGQIIRSRQAKLRKDIDLIDDILADGKISEAHLRMLIERIYVYETEGGLSLEIKVKAPFQNHTDSYENGVLTNSEIEELIGVN